MKKILTVPHPKLRAKTKAVTNVDKKLIKFIQDLQETLINKQNPQGVGLAAPQVGKLIKAFTLNLNRPEIFINPIITKKSPQLTFGPDQDNPIFEGCLSMPQIYGPVPRYEWIDIEYQIIKNEKLENRKKRIDAFEARVFQHELDHLEGILFTDHSLKLDLPVYKEFNNKYEEIDHSLLELF